MNTQSDGGTGSGRERASRTAEETRRHGRDFVDSARENASRFANEQKETGARQVENVARAVDRAADELEQSSPEIARYTRQMASGVHGASEALQRSSIGELFDKLNGFARREPAAFMGAAMVAGFAASRFLEASGRHHESEPRGGGHDPATGERP